MKKYINKETILLLIIVFLAAWNIFNTKSVRTDVKGYKEKINAIETNIDSAKNVNKVIDKKIEKVDEKVVSITKEIYHIDKTIEVVKNNTNEKIDDANNFGVNELELFFANRYK